MANMVKGFRYVLNCFHRGSVFHRDWPGATICSFTALCSAVSSSIRVLADRAGDLIGPNVQLHHTKMFIKPPERAVLHASGLSLFPHEKDIMIASTIHFDDCADRKRGVRVVPDSHKRGSMEHGMGAATCRSSSIRCPKGRHVRQPRVLCCTSAI